MPYDTQYARHVPAHGETVGPPSARSVRPEPVEGSRERIAWHGTPRAVTHVTTFRRLAAATLVSAVAALALLACTTVSPLPEAEQRAQAVEKSLICPICPGETIDRSQVQLAKDMQAIVRVQIDEGRSDAEIRQFFVDRYGERVLASPPREGFHWLVWVAPPVGIALGLLALFWVTQAMGRQPPEQQPAAAEGDLEPYLRQVDRELSADSDTQEGERAGFKTPVPPEPVEGPPNTNTGKDT